MKSRKSFAEEKTQATLRTLLDEFSYYRTLTPQDQVKRVREGQITTQQLHKMTRFGIELFRPTLNAIAGTYYDAVKETGIPHIPKDNIPAAGLELKYGFPVSKGLKQQEDSPLIKLASRTLKEHYGLELEAIATTSLPGGGMHTYDYKTRNALNPEYISGGSSSGMGTAAAAGINQWVWGGDIAGSIRIPQFYNGLSGVLAPTYHHHQVQHVLEKKAQPTAEELAEYTKQAYKTPPAYGFQRPGLESITLDGSVWQYGLSIGENPDEYLKRMSQPPHKKRRIAILKNTPTSEDCPTDETLADSIHDIAKRMKEAGNENIEFVEIDPTEFQAHESRKYAEAFSVIFSPLIADIVKQFPEEEVFNEKDPTAAFRKAFTK